MVVELSTCFSAPEEGQRQRARARYEHCSIVRASSGAVAIGSSPLEISSRRKKKKKHKNHSFTGAPLTLVRGLGVGLDWVGSDCTDTHTGMIPNCQ